MHPSPFWNYTLVQEQYLLVKEFQNSMRQSISKQSKICVLNLHLLFGLFTHTNSTSHPDHPSPMKLTKRRFVELKTAPCLSPPGPKPGESSSYDLSSRLHQLTARSPSGRQSHPPYKCFIRAMKWKLGFRLTRKTNPLTKLELPTTMRHLQVLHEDQSPLLGLGGQDTAAAEEGSF